MGGRSRTETTARLLVAFLRQRTWRQHELARHCDCTVRTLRRNLDELLTAGMPLERDEDDGHVYWSVPLRWFPGGAFLRRDDVDEVARLIARLPKTEEREGLIGRLLEGTDGDRRHGNEEPMRESPEVVAAFEDAVDNAQALAFRYFSASRGERGLRVASPHRIAYHRPVKVAATCHRDGCLKWFRLDRVETAVPASEPFRAAEDAQVARFVEHSFGGFHGRGEVRPVVFAVDREASRWILDAIPSSYEAQREAGEVHVTVCTASLTSVARFVVGLGAMARPLTPALRAEVRRLAAEALEACVDEPVHLSSSTT